MLSHGWREIGGGRAEGVFNRFGEPMPAADKRRFTQGRKTPALALGRFSSPCLFGRFSYPPVMPGSPMGVVQLLHDNRAS